MTRLRKRIQRELDKVLETVDDKVVVDSAFICYLLSKTYIGIAEKRDQSRNPIQRWLYKLTLKEIQAMQTEYANIPDN